MRRLYVAAYVRAQHEGSCSGMWWRGACGGVVHVVVCSSVHVVHVVVCARGACGGVCTCSSVQCAGVSVHV